MTYKIAAGTTSYIAEFPVYDSSSTTGALLSGLSSTSTGMTCYYSRANATGATVINISTATKGTFTASAMCPVDATNMAGIYQLGIPNAVIATGSYAATVVVRGASNMVPVIMHFEIGDDVGTQYLEGTYTRAQVERMQAATLLGVSSGMGVGSPVFSAAGTSGTARVSGTVDASGNRTAITLNP